MFVHAEEKINHLHTRDDDDDDDADANDDKYIGIA